jgi:hypothetical protein
VRYGLTELLLVQPGAAGWRPAPDPDAPEVRRALALAKRPAPLKPDEGMDIGSLPAIGLYHSARHPERLAAPPTWSRELALLLAESVLAALGEGMRTWRAAVLRGPPLTAAGLALGALRRRAERAQARRIQLTALTAPQRRFHPHLLVLMAASAIYWLLRLTGRARRPERLPWSLLAAREAVRRIDERRSWQRAYAAAVARSDQARSSAASSTSGAWAPEIP